MFRNLIAMLLCLAAAAAQADIAPSFELTGTRLNLLLPDGRRLVDQDLVGVQLSLTDAHGNAQDIRIDSWAADPRDTSGDVVLYNLAVREPGAGQWQPYCNADPDGRRAAIFMPGDASLQITCSAGAIGKCVRFGYHPWKLAADGRPMRDYHTACVKLLRGEYCGDGEPFTENGTLIDIYDRIGVQTPGEADGLAFEAAWGPDGAVCVARTRKPHLLTLDQLKRRCPKVEVRQDCASADSALVYNRSRP
jgi:hypothetical protein